MAPKSGKQTIAIYTLPDISRSKGNQQSDNEIWSVNRI